MYRGSNDIKNKSVKNENKKSISLASLLHHGGNVLLGCLLGISFLKAQEVTFDALNEEIEISHFQGENFFGDDKKKAAKSLKWTEESRVDTLASYRLSAKPMHATVLTGALR